MNMKNFIRNTAIIITALILSINLYSCQPPDDIIEKIDPSKTQLYVYNYNGGYGNEWLEKAKKRFEEIHKDDTHWETGKKGVQIVYSLGKETLELSKLANSRDEVFFQESLDYYQLCNNNYAIDITDIVTETLTKYGEDKSIIDKYSDEQKDYYKIDNKYYGIPHYFSFFGISNNIDLWDQCGFWIMNDGYNAETIENQYNLNGRSTAITFGKKTDGTLSPGPDGILGTYDDGLPATYAEFYLMCDYMYSEYHVIPLHWSGANYRNYLTMFVTALAASNVGKEQMMLNYTFNGSADNLAIIENGKPVIDANPTTISTLNGYELSRQIGKYDALTFLHKIINSPNYYSIPSDPFTLVFSNSHSHIDAQKKFLYSGNDGVTNYICMLIEGCWWQNEANNVFKAMESTMGADYNKFNRNFGFMPFPHPTAAQIGKSTLYDLYSAVAFIRNGTPEWKVPLAKEFLQFCNTDISLREYSSTTNTLKALNYELTEDDLDKMTTYGKYLYNIKNASDIIYPLSSNPFYLNNSSVFRWANIFNSKIGGGGTLNMPPQAFKDNASITPQAYFTGMYQYSQDNWNNYNQ